MGNKIILKKNLLVEDKTTLKFKVRNQGGFLEGFLVFYNGNYYAYVNKCKHLEVELDWEPNNFFDEENRFIVCATHGALYEPDSGFCVSGPCKGAVLDKLKVKEMDDQLEIIT